MSGDTGDDVLVSLDDSIGDRVDGGAGGDVLWMDQNGDDTDNAVGTDRRDFLNAVTAFTNAGTDRTLDGDRIADPLTLPGDRYEQFADRPLFSSQGPTVDDFSQGQLGDCWLLAGLGSTAMVRPDLIKAHVVDFKDGTYGVRLGDNFYRVDNDFAVAIEGSQTLQYTAPGLEDSLWVAVMEKAYTHYRTGENTFASIEGGFAFDVWPAFGLGQEQVWYDPSLPIDQFSTYVQTMLDSGFAPTIGFSVVPPGVQLIEAHQYIVLGYTLDPHSGMVDTITLRNPWGVDGPSSGPTGLSDDNFDDGIVTITLDELASCQGSFEWGVV